MKKKILYIEDNEMNRLLVRRLLEREGYEIFEAFDGLSGIKKAEELEPDLILMDINLPSMDGLAASTRIKSINKLSDTPIIAITSNAMEGDRERTLAAGCDGYIRKPLEPEDFPNQIKKYLAGAREALSEETQTATLKNYSEKLVENLEHHVRDLENKNAIIERQAKEMQEAYLGIILSFVRAVEEKHKYTAGHSARVRAYSVKIGEELKLEPDELEKLSIGAILHDIGKLVIEISSLKNTGKLTDEEWEEMKKHPEVGYKILKSIAFLSGMINIVHQHHERWDGTGYPQNLKGGQIDFLASIVAVADTFDAMTTTRGYNKVLSPADAFGEILRQSGKYFNPKVVMAFGSVVEQLIEKKEKRDAR